LPDIPIGGNEKKLVEKVERIMKKRLFSTTLRVVLVFLFVGVVVAPCIVAADVAEGRVAIEKSLGEVQSYIQKESLRWTAGETSLSRLTPEERLNLLGGQKEIPGERIKTPEPAGGLVPYRDGGAPPGSFDWRANPGNFVTNIKLQGCSDCWAFAAAAALESKVKIVKGSAGYPVDLSEQQIKCYGHGTCTDWNLGGTFDFLVATGTPYEACFPYVGGTVAGDPECDSARCICWDQASLTKVISYDFKTLDPGWSNTISRDDLKTAIMTNGPVAVHMNVYNDFHKFYTGGVYQHTASSGPIVGGHFIAIIGWDDTDQAWIGKNSWGTGWGEDTYGRSGEAGYFRMAYTEPTADFGYNVMIINTISGPAANTAPAADVHGTYAGLEMVPVTLTCSGSDTADDCIIAKALDLDDDGTYETDAMSGSVSHTWQDDFFGQVGLMVRDSFGVEDMDSTSVTIANQNPTAYAGSDQTVDEGAGVSFSGIASDPSPADTLTYTWNFGDGSPVATGSLTPSHEYCDDGVYTVTLTVQDDNGGLAFDTMTVTVNNVAPVADAGPDVTVNEGQEVSFSASATDPGCDTFTYHWDFGDGVNSADVQDVPFIYCDNGVYTVTLTVTDDDGASDTDTAIITVNNVAPAANAGPDQAVDEGELVSFSGSASDAGWCDTLTYSWDFGDGSPAVTGTLTPEHTYCDDGAYTVMLTVTDDDGGVGTDTLTVTVNNVAPTVTKGAMDQPNPQFILPYQELTFHGTFSDPGWCDTHTANWEFGDGQTSAGTLTEEEDDPPSVTGTVEVSHAYGAPGDYSVTVTVTDDDGGATTAAAWSVHVSDVAEAKHDLADYIQGLPATAFKGKADQRKNALANMFSALDEMIADEEWNGFVSSLQNNVREKADGLIDGKTGDDWITTYDAQYHVCMKIDDIVAYVETFP